MSNYNPKLLARITRAAAIGSKATTLRGQLRAVLRDVAAGRYRLSAPEIRCEYSYPRPALTVAQREERRAAADPRFRVRWIAAAKRRLQEPGDANTVWSHRRDRDVEIRRAVGRVAPRVKLPPAPYALLDLSEDAADYLGWDRRGKEASWCLGWSHGVDATPGQTTWKGGRAVAYTRAERTTTIRAVVYSTPAGVAVSARGTKRSIEVEIPGATLAAIAPAAALLPGDLIGLCCAGLDSVVQRYDYRGRATGVAVVTVYGYEHGRDVAECLDEIQRKAALYAAEARAKAEREASERRSARQRQRDARAVRLLARLSTYAVDFDAARATGACRAGIEAWCAARGVNPTATVELRDLARDADSTARGIAAHYARRLWVDRTDRGLSAAA